MQLRKVKRAALLPLISSLRLQKRRRLVRAWRSACVWLAALRATKATCVARLRLLSLARAVSAWRDCAARKQHHRSGIPAHACTEIPINKSVTSLTLYTLRREVLTHCNGRMRHKQLAEALAEWRDEATACRALSSMGRLILQRIAKGRLSSMLQLWKVGSGRHRVRFLPGACQADGRKDCSNLLLASDERLHAAGEGSGMAGQA